MGSCCSSSRRSEPSRSPVYIYHQQDSYEHEALSSTNIGSSPESGIVGVGRNLDTSTPDTYTPPPLPLPFDAGFAAHDGEKPDRNIKTMSNIEFQKLPEDDHCDKPVKSPSSEEEDVCPICLEEYDDENPRNLTKCEHHFHLSCILEWMERSDTCPVCDQITLVDEMFE